MGESPDESVGDGEKAESDAIKASTSGSAETEGETPPAQAADAARNLPVVWSPKLGLEDAPANIESTDEPPAFDAGEEMPPDDEAVDGAPSEPTVAAPTHTSRFVLLAATIALAAAIGSFLGSLSASGVVRLLPAGVKTTSTADASDVLQAVRAQVAELSALKANIDGANHSASTQFAKLADRLDKIDRRAAAAPEITGSIAAAPPPAPATEPKPPVVDGWAVQDVENGRALVTTRYGGVFEVGSGSFLPGLGRVETIKREDGKWIVVTARGVITSMH